MTFRPIPQKLLEQLRRRRSAHFALLSPAGSYPAQPAEAVFEELAGDRLLADDLIVHASFGEEGLDVIRASRGARDDDLGPSFRTDDQLRDRLEPKLPVILVVEGVERLPLAGQLIWLSRFRALRERASRHPFQLVASGAWEVRAALAEWKRSRSDLSPPLDTNNIYWLTGYELDDVEELMRPYQGRGSALVARALVETLHQHTAGDRRFVNLFLESLDVGLAPEEIERRIFELAEHATVADPVLASLDGLGGGAHRKLVACLRHGTIALRDGDLDAERLWLQGLLRRSARSLDRCEPASPLVGSVLRRYHQRLGLSRRDVGSDREHLPPKHPTGALASMLVSEIECLLRNVIVTMLAGVEGLDHPLQAVRRTAQQDLYARALERRDEDLRSPHVRFVRQPLSAHLDVADLCSIITDADLHERHFRRVYRDKAQFAVKFQEFNDIRKAVAHNKLSSVRVLDELGKLLDYFEAGIAYAAAEASAEEPPSSLLEIGQVRVLPVPQKEKLVVEVELKNIAESSLYGVVAVASFLDAKGNVCHPEVRSEGLTFKRGESRVARLECKLAPKAPLPLPDPEIAVIAARRDQGSEPPAPPG